jgi:hypothetical protein
MAEMKIVVDESLKRRFKGACGEKGATMSDVAAELIQGWLDGKFVLQSDAEQRNRTAGQDKQA